ncbi:beta-glucosidase family protein [Sandaracinobacteroides saxicola]|uniref:Glycoside hydrolase family 3 C-terminal domain-containing protein n=1 Tax=Sandaracinobacteroides saxicola TaxID=2759707 RepID=A0A7G5IHF5_9SPHN|nr:glycoside hydrolase family 3 C-terminal domain-containing protein [Sandaracinobacteroides saxicola]QMW22797.1 glycoside hydrolase family 3 C-terminal domain-containing protein [Sandaracinobacteroides saxicola]
MTDLSPTKGMTPAEIAARVDAILAEATLEEKVGMMSGRGFFDQIRDDGGIWGARPYRAGGGMERLNVPAFWFTDGPRGVARGESTCFPCTMARGASFDTDLERRIGEAMSIEIRAQDCNLTGAVCVNLLRHPAWGRAQETYGEDPHHLGAMGAALAVGLQTHNVAATVKHFALNSMENARFKVNVEIDERALHEVYLPHFKTILDAGCMTVMSSYNKLNGEYCGQHRHLLTDILRGEWGFTGFVHSDWVMGVYKQYGASAGLDVENPEPLVFGKKLVAAVEAGHIAPGDIDTACRRILTTLYTISAAEDPLPAYPLSLVASEAHAALALEAAEKSAVLLANDGTLPLKKGARLAVLGKLAAMVNTGDNGSSRVRARHVVTALEGLRAVAEVVTGDEDDLAAATAAAGGADAAVVVVGYTAEDEGEFIPGDITLGQEDQLDPVLENVPEEVKAARKRRPFSIGGDRLDLGLRPEQVALIHAAADSGRPVIVVIVAGSAVMVEGWHDRAAAILQTFYSGQAGGTALARLLFGDVSPSGKLPFMVAQRAEDYPFFDRDADRITYDQWHGYAKFDRERLTARYGFGHGLSYARFDTRAPRARVTPVAIELEATVANLGECAAETPVLAFVAPPGKAVERWSFMLKAFTRVALAPGESRTVRLAIPLDTLRYRDVDSHGWRLEPGDYTLYVGHGSGSGEQQSLTVRL